MEHDILTHDAWVLTIDDVKTAFDTVNIDLLMDYHRRHLTGACPAPH